MNKSKFLSYIRVLVFVGALTMLLIGIAYAGTTPPFTIEGTVPDGLTETHLPDPEGNEKELGPLNSSTTKLAVIDDDVPPTLGYTNPNGQVDFADVWIDTKEDGDGDIWFYFGWMRDSKKGTGVITVELGQNGPPVNCDYTKIGTPEEPELIANCNPWENRATGDTLFLWDQQGNNLVIQQRTFDDELDTWGPTYDLDSSIAKAAYSADGFYGEVAINLTAAIFEHDVCTSIGNIIPGTITGNSDTADYKDTVLGGTGISISNCGSIKVIKEDDFGVRLNGITFDIYQSDGDQDFEPDSGDTWVADCTTANVGGDDGVCFVYDLFEDFEHWIAEDTSAVPDGYDPAVPSEQLVTIAADVTTEVIFENPRQRGSIVIEKVVKSTLTRIDGATFALDSDGDPLTANDQTPIGAVSGETGLFCVENLLFDTYHVVETVTPTNYEAVTDVQSFTVNTKSDCSDAAIREADLTFENEALPTLVTSATGSATVGDFIYDTATLSNGFNPTGSITFNLFYNDATCSGVSLFTEVIPVTGNGSYTTDPGYQTVAAGTYYWLVSYSGDDSNRSASHACGALGEVTTVGKESPGLTTSATTGVTVGDFIYDTATLSNGFNPTGNIYFNLFYNDDTCSSVPLFVQEIEVTGNGSYTTNPGFQTYAAGTYYWLVSYSGDGNNEPASHDCGAAGEVSEVNKAQPSISTTPKLLPNDAATISGLFEPAGGTITFELYATADCSGDILYSEPAQNVTGNGTYQTNNTSVFITIDGTYSWYVNYTGDGNNNGVISYCNAEQQIIDFTPLTPE